MTSLRDRRRFTEDIFRIFIIDQNESDQSLEEAVKNLMGMRRELRSLRGAYMSPVQKVSKEIDITNKYYEEAKRMKERYLRGL